MPSWKSVLCPQPIWTLAPFLRCMDKPPLSAAPAWQKATNPPAAGFMTKRLVDPD